MSTRKYCDACGADMTEDPAASGHVRFEAKQDSLEARQTSPDRAWPRAAAIRLEITAVRLNTHPRATYGEQSWAVSDICIECIRHLIATGTATGSTSS